MKRNLGLISAALSCLAYPPREESSGEERGSFPEQRLVIEPKRNLPYSFFQASDFFFVRFADLTNDVPFPLTNVIFRFSDRVKLKSALPYIQNSFHDKLCETHGKDIIERRVVIKLFNQHTLFPRY